MRSVGPVRIIGPVLDDELFIPLATYESPLWPSVERGARVTAAAGGIRTVIHDDRMTRSVLFEAPDAETASAAIHEIRTRMADLAAVAEAGSRYTKFLDMHDQVVGNLLFLRLEMHTGDASGHNMVTAGADRVVQWVLDTFPSLQYVSVSGNYCSDKKPTAVNAILGRGKSVIAETLIPEKLCSRFLKTTPHSVAELNTKKNLIGTMIAGGIRTANAHYANILLGFYLATGQDAANIVEGSQGITYATVRDGALYFSCTIPNIIVGTVGAGKNLPFVSENLERLGCTVDRPAGDNARRLAAICGAAILCGELSLLAALTNQGELMEAHTRLERG
jgi:hydroxymethylglutaryl-CoA reductase (NADPH)